MARKRKLRVTDSDGGEGSSEDSPVETEQKTYTIIVASHTHAGVVYKSGDPISFENPASARKLKKRGIIS